MNNASGGDATVKKNIFYLLMLLLSLYLCGSETIFVFFCWHLFCIASLFRIPNYYNYYMSFYTVCLISTKRFILIVWQQTIACWRGGVPFARFVAHKCCDVGCSKAVIARVVGTALVCGGVVHPRTVIRRRGSTTVLKYQI